MIFDLSGVCQEIFGFELQQTTDCIHRLSWQAFPSAVRRRNLPIAESH